MWRLALLHARAQREYAHKIIAMKVEHPSPVGHLILMYLQSDRQHRFLLSNFEYLDEWQVLLQFSATWISVLGE
jgi:hypothetical protein